MTGVYYLLRSVLKCSFKKMQNNFFAVSNPPKCIANLRTQPMHFKMNLEIYQTSFVMKEVIKRLTDFQNKMMTRDRKRDFMETAYLHLTLKEFRYKLVYLNELHMSMHQENIYSWSKRVILTIVAINHSSFIITFVIAFSNN